MLDYYPRHISSINMPIFRRKICIHTASDIFAHCKRLYSTLVESGLQDGHVNARNIFEHNIITYILLMNKELCIKVGKWNNSIFYVFISIYNSLHVSSTSCSSSGETNCINTASGNSHSILVAEMCAGWKKSFSNLHTSRPPT